MFWIIVCAALFLFCYSLIRKFTHWSRRGIPQQSVLKALSCATRLLLQLDVQAEALKQLYDDHPEKRYVGAFQFINPVLCLRDIELIKQITIKDFDHFVDRNQFLPEEIDPLWGKNLVALKGDRWRDMRSTLSPSFTSSKMRGMFCLMDECAQQFVRHFKTNQGTQTVEMKDVFTRYANDVIATTAFGIVCDSLANPENEFYLMGKKSTTFRGLKINFKIFMMLTLPTIAKWLGIRFFNDEVSTFFRTLVKTNIESREKNGIVRPDMIHLLMEARNGRLKHEDQNPEEDSGFAAVEESPLKKEEKVYKKELSDDDITAQALIFFFAGFETVSTLMSFLIYEVAVNPEIQEKLRKEVDKTVATNGASLTYEALLKLKYMDMVVSETLRKWPVSILVDRVCTKPYTIQPVKENEKPFDLQSGDIILFPIFPLHRDPENYPNPDRFDPERFCEENKATINQYSYVPFGAGPRNCIGNRFALLEAKTILFHILANFELVVTEKTDIPLKLAKDQFNITSKNGFWLGLKTRVL